MSSRNAPVRRVNAGRTHELQRRPHRDAGWVARSPTMSMTLPLEIPTGCNPAMRDAHVLLVADDLTYAQFLCGAMTADPLRQLAITHVTSLSPAASRLDAATFDLVLLDLVLPDGSG